MLSRLKGRRLLVAAILLVALLLGLFLWGQAKPAEQPKTDNRIMLMSSIPMQWGEVGIGEIAKGESEPAALFVKLSESNTVTVIDDFQKLGGPQSAVLLLVQPRALAPRELVELDSWIRAGGSALIFADPALDWPSDLPLGDPRRPLFTSLLTPMFGHWGLELALPVSEETEDQATSFGQYPVTPRSAGIWSAAGKEPSAQCRIREDQLVAFCAVGKGRALLIADADMLLEDNWTDSVMTEGTMAWLQAAISAMREQVRFPTRLWEIQGK
jgi:hypothetical protein